MLFQAGDSDFEEFVEVGANDGEELDAFEQGVCGIGCLGQNALVELKPTEFAGQETRTLRDGHGVGEVNSARWVGRENLVTKGLTIFSALVG